MTRFKSLLLVKTSSHSEDACNRHVAMAEGMLYASRVSQTHLLLMAVSYKQQRKWGISLKIILRFLTTTFSFSYNNVGMRVKPLFLFGNSSYRLVNHNTYYP